jgi:hypothetical protein
MYFYLSLEKRILKQAFFSLVDIKLHNAQTGILRGLRVTHLQLMHY